MKDFVVFGVLYLRLSDFEPFADALAGWFVEQHLAGIGVEILLLV